MESRQVFRTLYFSTVSPKMPYQIIGYFGRARRNTRADYQQFIPIPVKKCKALFIAPKRRQGLYETCFALCAKRAAPNWRCLPDKNEIFLSGNSISRKSAGNGKTGVLHKKTGVFPRRYRGPPHSIQIIPKKFEWRYIMQVLQYYVSKKFFQKNYLTWQGLYHPSCYSKYSTGREGV